MQRVRCRTAEVDAKGASQHIDMYFCNTLQWMCELSISSASQCCMLQAACCALHAARCALRAAWCGSDCRNLGLKPCIISTCHSGAMTPRIFNRRPGGPWASSALRSPWKRRPDHSDILEQGPGSEGSCSACTWLQRPQQGNN